MANVLIVEDEKNMREIIAEYMRRGGHTCFTADDYMTKPFSPKVLLAKANALLRRSSALLADTLSAGKIAVIPAAHQVFLDGQEITLTHKEYELLSFFMANPGQKGDY